MLSKLSAPVPEGPRVPYVRRLKKGERLEACVASEKPQWIMTHFSKEGGQRACEASRKPDGAVIDYQGCRGCLGNHPSRMRGYLWMWNFLQKEMEWFEITEWCWTTIVMRSNGKQSLQGMKIVVTRGGGDRARFIVDLAEWSGYSRPEIFPPEPDVDPSIRRIMKG